MITLVKAAAILTLWRSGQFDTLDISDALDIAEPDVCRVIAAARDAERGEPPHAA